jgi:PHD/YefM family antitoxin component YafN of YafNO toxin-antitoxin module
MLSAGGNTGMAQESIVITDDEQMTAEDWAQMMVDDQDEPTPQEMERSNKIAARYEQEKTHDLPS